MYFYHDKDIMHCMAFNNKYIFLWTIFIFIDNECATLKTFFSHKCNKMQYQYIIVLNNSTNSQYSYQKCTQVLTFNIFNFYVITVQTQCNFNSIQIRKFKNQIMPLLWQNKIALAIKIKWATDMRQIKNVNWTRLSLYKHEGNWEEARRKRTGPSSTTLQPIPLPEQC